MRLTRHLMCTLSLAATMGCMATAWAQPATPGAVKIGVLADMSSLYADIGGPAGIEATRLAIEDFKARNPGIQIELLSADGQNKPDVASAIARRWFEVENVDLIVDLPTSAIALAVGKLAQEKNKVAIVTSAGSSDITGKHCNPNTLHWTWDTWSVSHGTASAVTQAGGKTWFFLTADYVFGHSLERDAGEVVKESGGQVLGSVRHPLDTRDFSSYMLQAQTSKAQIIGLANGGGDTINSIKSAAEFGLVRSGQKLAAMVVFISDVHSLGLKDAQGLMLTTAFYWDRNDSSRRFGERMGRRNNGRMPTMTQAGAYSATMKYLEAVAKVGSPKDGAAVVKTMQGFGTYEDPLFGPTTVRPDGRVIHDMLLVEVKKPDESKRPYDYYKIVATIPPEKAFRPLKDGGCPLTN